MIHIRYVRVHVYGNTITKKIWYGFTDTKHTHADTRASFLSVSHARARARARAWHTDKGNPHERKEKRLSHRWKWCTYVGRKKSTKRNEKKRERKPGETIRACGSMTSAKTKDEGIAWSDQIRYTLKIYVKKNIRLPCSIVQWKIRLTINRLKKRNICANGTKRFDYYRGQEKTQSSCGRRCRVSRLRVAAATAIATVCNIHMHYSLPLQFVLYRCI